MCVLCVPCQAEHAKLILSVLRILILTYICTNEKCLRVYLHFSFCFLTLLLTMPGATSLGPAVPCGLTTYVAQALHAAASNWWPM